MGMSWAFQKPWEDFFTVVQWDQRGVGKLFEEPGRFLTMLLNDVLPLTEGSATFARLP